VAEKEKIEREGFHNQTVTAAGLRAQKPSGTAKNSKKVVALQLDEREQAAFKFLGGVEGLKTLLCPKDRCIRCRKNKPQRGSRFDSLCEKCDKLTNKQG